MGITFVAALSVLTLLFSRYETWRDSNQFKAETYQVLIDKVNTLVEQNNREIQNQKDTQITDPQNQILDLKKKNSYLK